ncbi:ABC transporter ATP-binding protein [Candidatus Woesearchaeota archaeon]|nr:ABC transporter ATP-binding protein [Candidatus Woesearchaeota archaeon]
MSPQPLIQLHDVWKTYIMGEERLDVLRGVNLTIHKGEFVAILGPSGSGKSTLMNQVGLLDVPTKGKITLENQDLSTLSENDLAQVRGKTIGFIFQQFNLIPTLTALENVMLPTLFQGLAQEERVRRATQLLATVGLDHRMDHKPGQLSGGQQQRVAIARSLVNNPSIILADEPTGNLDSISGTQIFELLIHLHRDEHKTLILITHDEELAHHAQRIVYMKDGKVDRIEERKTSTTKKNTKNNAALSPN